MRTTCLLIMGVFGGAVIQALSMTQSVEALKVSPGVNVMILGPILAGAAIGLGLSGFGRPTGRGFP